MDGKLPPQAIDLEESIIGSILLESTSDYVTDILPELKPEYFYKPQNKFIMQAILNCLNRNEPADILTVINELKKMGKLEQVGGPFHISTLTNGVASSSNIEFHLRLVIEKYLRREVINGSSKLIADSYDETKDVFEIIDKSEENVNTLLSGIVTDKVVSVSDIHEESIIRNQKLLDNKELTIGVPSGFSDLDRITGGWQPSDFIILAARPAMGKTSLMLEFAKNPAIKGKPIGVFSLEMAKSQLYSRTQSQVSGYPLEDIMRRGIKPKDQQDFYNKCSLLSSAPIYIDDTPAITIFDLRNKVRKLKRDKGIELILIDYIQLMTGKGYNRENEISKISGGLKSLAKELNIPVIALSQLSRAVESRGGDKIPMLSDLRESGSLEQDADMVMFLHRPEYYDILQDEEGNSTIGKASIIIAKHRNGSTGNVVINFNKHNVSFSNRNEEVTKMSPLSPSEEFDYPMT